MKEKITNFLKETVTRRFLNLPVNISIIFTFFAIIVVQICFIKFEWIKNNLINLYNVVNGSNLLVGIFLAFLPLIFSLIVFIFQKAFKSSHLKSVFYGIPEKTKIFPGFITQEMIDSQEVIFIKDRCQENMHKPMILDRQIQCENILNHINSIERKEHVLNCLFLTGSSGSGKSLLINNVLKHKLNDSDTCIIISDKYNEGETIYKSLLNKCSIVIMDQFEDSLNNVRIYEVIKKLVYNSNEPIIFVFVFPQEFFDRIHMALKNVFFSEQTDNSMYNPDLLNSTTYFLQSDNYDVLQLIELVNSFEGEGADVEKCLDECIQSFNAKRNFKSVIESNNYKQSLIFLCSVLAKIKIGISPLVEFSIISYIYELFHEEIDLNLEYYIENTDNVIDLYFNKWAKKFSHDDIAKIILYLISDKNLYTDTDLMYITFEPKECFVETSSKNNFNIITAMKSNSFIRVANNFSGFNYGISAIHDYVAVKMNEYCFKNLSNEIRQNVDHYRKIMSRNKIGKTAFAESVEKIKIKKRYENYNDISHKIYVNFFVFILMMASLLASCYRGSNAQNSAENYYIIFTAVNCMFSTYYIYNIIMQFLRILEIKQYFLVTFWGAFSIILCFAFPQFWGIELGIEVVILGGTLRSLRKETVNIAKDEFKKKGNLYIVFGLLMSGLGVLFYFNPSMPYYIFFLLYVISCNYTHIHFNYMISKIGMANTF